MNKLRISRETFLELYGDLMPYNIFITEPQNDTKLIEKYMISKLWRMNNLYTIVDKDGNRIPFVMNQSQHRVYAAYRKHPRLIILKSRQQGISTFWLVFFFDAAVFGDDLNIGLMAQGKDEASTLLKRVKLAWDELPDLVKSFLHIRLGKNNSEEFSFDNGSTIFVRVSFRSATLQGLHISEFGKIANKYPERAKETKTGTLQAIKPGLPVAIESTAEGNNDFKHMWDTAMAHRGQLSGKDFKPVFLSWLDDPDCSLKVYQEATQKQDQYFAKLEDELAIQISQKQRNFWIAQYRELGDDIYQEYPSTPEEAFAVVRDGAYYARLYREHVVQKEREVKSLYDPNLDVRVAIDLGMNDDCVLVFYQRWNKEWRIIAEYVNSGEGLEHYVNVMASKGYPIAKLLAPHDVKVRDLSTGKSRLHRFRELGMRNVKVLPRIPITTGVELVRKIIPNLYIDPACTYLISCFKNYSKEWDEKLQVWKDKPLHNEFSHGADGIRYMAMDDMASKSNKSPRHIAKSGVVDGLAL